MHVMADQAGVDGSDHGVLESGSDDETTDNESMYGEPIEGDSNHLTQNLVFSTARSKQSNAVGKRSVAGPSAGYSKR